MNKIKERLREIILDLHNVTEEIDKNKPQFNNIEELYKYIEPIIASDPKRDWWIGIAEERSKISLAIPEVCILLYKDQNFEREKFNLIMALGAKYEYVFYDDDNSTRGLTGFEKYIFFYPVERD
jgi:hypothetical protein